MHYVSVEGLTKSYGINPLFSNISFHINEGDKIALIARNGIGKSTLLRILTGKETPDSGKFWVHKDVTVALFEQDPQFEEGKSVLENIFELNHPILPLVLSPFTWTNEYAPLTHEILNEKPFVSAHRHEGVRR